MPIKLNSADEKSVISSSIPVYGNGYTPASHKQVIEASKKILGDNNIKLVSNNGQEEIKFIGSNNNEVVAAYFVVNTPSNPDYDLVFAWVNSYTRSMRFKCAVGCKSKNESAIFIKHYFSVKKGGDIADIIDLMDSVVKNIYPYYENTISELEALSFHNFTREQVCSTLGDIFFNKNLITPHQASTLQKWMTETFKDAAVWSASDVYELLALVTYTYHPRLWLSTHAEIHEYLTDKFGQQIPIESTLDYNRVKSVIDTTYPEVSESVDDIEDKLDAVVENKEVVIEETVVPTERKNVNEEPVLIYEDANLEQESAKIEHAVVEEKMFVEDVEEEEAISEESCDDEDESEDEKESDFIEEEDSSDFGATRSTIDDDDFTW
jgi:hypothetical protein